MAAVHQRIALARSRFRENGAGYHAPLVGSLLTLAITLIRPSPLLADPFPRLQRNLNKATANAIALIRAAIERFDQIAAEPSAAHSALELAIWTDRKAIPPAAREHYGVLVEKYL